MGMFSPFLPTVDIIIQPFTVLAFKRVLPNSKRLTAVKFYSTPMSARPFGYSTTIS